MSNVSLVKGDDRKENILKALELIKSDIKIGDKQVLIKPNFVSTDRQLAATHVDCIRGILDFLKTIYKKKVIIGECSFGNTKEGYKNFGYDDLLDEYDIELVDLNHDEYELIEISNGKKVRVSKTLLDPNTYIISPALLKTHDSVVATLSLKNIVMGSIINDEKNKDKWHMHQGVKEINYDIFRLSKKLKPDLAVIDGFQGMEGEGPCHGTAIDVKAAIVSTDFLAADRVGLEVMEINPAKVGYLNYCAEAKMGEFDLKKIKILGNKIEECKKKFKLHSTVEAQYGWK